VPQKKGTYNWTSPTKHRGGAGTEKSAKVKGFRRKNSYLQVLRRGRELAAQKKVSSPGEGGGGKKPWGGREKFSSRKKSGGGTLQLKRTSRRGSLELRGEGCGRKCLACRKKGWNSELGCEECSRGPSEGVGARRDQKEGDSIMGSLVRRRPWGEARRAR